MQKKYKYYLFRVMNFNFAKIILNWFKNVYVWINESLSFPLMFMYFVMLLANTLLRDTKVINIIYYYFIIIIYYINFFFIFFYYKRILC